MSLLYKDPKDLITTVDIRQENGEVIFDFFSDCGKHHTDEHIDEIRITPEKLLVMLKKESVKGIIKENLDKYYLQ
jgi:hypothetical protein